MEGHTQDPDAIKTELGARKMKRITRWMIFAFLVLQVLAYGTETKIIGWDYCTEEEHPFILIVFKFGFPIPGIIVNQIWGCLSTPNQWVELSWPGIIGTTIFWITVFWILESYWPVWLPDCQYHYLCADKEVSKEICEACRKLRGE